jgi:hypothetical protein
MELFGEKNQRSKISWQGPFNAGIAAPRMTRAKYFIYKATGGCLGQNQRLLVRLFRRVKMMKRLEYSLFCLLPTSKTKFTNYSYSTFHESNDTRVRDHFYSVVDILLAWFRLSFANSKLIPPAQFCLLDILSFTILYIYLHNFVRVRLWKVNRSSFSTEQAFHANKFFGLGGVLHKLHSA